MSLSVQGGTTLLFPKLMMQCCQADMNMASLVSDLVSEIEFTKLEVGSVSIDFAVRMALGLGILARQPVTASLQR